MPCKVFPYFYLVTGLSISISDEIVYIDFFFSNIFTTPCKELKGGLYWCMKLEQTCPMTYGDAVCITPRKFYRFIFDFLLP